MRGTRTPGNKGRNTKLDTADFVDDNEQADGYADIRDKLVVAHSPWCGLWPRTLQVTSTPARTSRRSKSMPSPSAQLPQTLQRPGTATTSKGK